MGRRRPIRMYRNLPKEEKSLEYDRAYRLATAEIFAGLKEKRGRYRRETRFWQGYYKAKPGKMQRSMRSLP